MMFFKPILRCKIYSTFLAKVNLNCMDIKLAHTVEHNRKKSIFFVTLDNTNKLAVLYYKLNHKVMDLRAINVPDPYKGRGLARLLTETAFTYAILHNYYLYLTCSYTQQYFLSNSNSLLKQRIVGPKKFLDISAKLDAKSFNQIQDPEDTVPHKKKY